MKFSQIFGVAAFAVTSQAAAIPADSFAPGVKDSVVSGPAYSQLLQVLGVSEATAQKLGLTEGQTAGDLAEEIAKLVDQQSGKRSDVVDVEISQRDFLGDLEQIPLTVLTDALNLLAKGAITGFDDLISTLGINATVANELGLYATQSISELINKIASIVETAIENGFKGSKRDFLGDLEQIPLTVLTDALNLLAKGAITGFDDLISTLGINATVANELGLYATQSISELINKIASIVETAIENGFKGSKRDFLGDLEQIPLTVLTDALNLLAKGAITGFDDLISTLGINATVANELGLYATQSISELINKIASIVETAIENGFKGSKRDFLGDLEQIPLTVLTDALNLLAKGAITGFDDLISTLGINATVANELGLYATQSISELINKIASIVETAIENGFKGSKRDFLGDLEQIPLTVLTDALNLLAKGAITGFDDLISTLGINATVANELGLYATQSISELINKIAAIVETAIENGFKGSKRDFLGDLEQIPLTVLTDALNLLAKGAITGFDALISTLGLNATTANRLGLYATENIGDLIKQVINITETAIENGFKGSKRDFLGDLEQIPLTVLTDALNLLAKGAITGFDDLISTLGINATVANELGLYATQSISELINKVATIVETAIENGFKGKRDDLASILSQIPIDVFTAVINGLAKGAVFGFDEVVGELGINAVLANKIGLFATQTTSELLNTLLHLVETSIEDGFANP
ncbi:uncharacterized protein LODBEIA_P52770 [Lodderomyces beijingensis]|uniref:Uncharacterized protein n=1 Tax=Lodderomyces beijingensis TaxID=1775926 RepID=A0ABP0ZSD7_9ASCO